jgi:glucose dehydrogenase
MTKALLGAVLGAAIATSAYHTRSKPTRSTAASAPQRASVRVGDPASTEWPTYGHDAGGMRFSPLTQITPGNVTRLLVAWVYHMQPPEAAAVPGEAGAADQGRVS